MSKDEILRAIDKMENYAIKSKFYRLLVTPRKYILGVFYRNIYYKLSKKGELKNVKTFWGENIQVLLPASMDIYLIGGKTHDSEIRLAKFYVNKLQENDDTIDIGSHIGYFSLLSSLLTAKGSTIAIEASPSTFSILQKNVQYKKNIKAINIALSNQSDTIEFLEFPILYSEYNTLEQEQYKNEDWFKSIQPNKIKIKTQKGTDIINEYNIQPKIIKIDVEGAEEKVVLGLIDYLKFNSSFVVMEFANKNRGNANHINAEVHLRNINYFPFKINSFGELEKLIVDTSTYITECNVESDNIVYQRIINE